MSDIPIAVIMGSDTDWSVTEHTINDLEALGIGYELEVISPHRTPEALHEYGLSLEERGFKVVIAASGGAAHLAGVLAALTTLPVIGVPVPSTSLGGDDALYSIVQMPAGVPVATVGIGRSGAKNAVVLAAKILGVADDKYKALIHNYKEQLVEESVQKAERVAADWQAELTI